MSTPRKTPKTWIDAGLKALKSTGPGALRAETLAREIGATKGSFYWHFKDVPAFHDALLAAWADEFKSRFEAALNKGDTTVTQLRALSRMPQTPLDAAIRAWSVYDKRAGKVVADLDRHIQHEISNLLADLEATHPDFPGLVHTAIISGPRKGSHAETLVDLLLVLK